MLKDLDISIFEKAMGSLHEGVLIADSKNTVLYVNEAYSKITGMNKNDIVNTNLEFSRPGSKMKEVLSSGKPIIGAHRTYGDREHIVNIVPIYQEEELIGGVAVSSSVSDIHEIYKKLEESEREIEKLKERINDIKVTRFSFSDIIVKNSNSLETKELAKKLAKNDLSILIVGESGTGKEVYAQSIHDASGRRNFPFIAINCSAINPNLLESELFGYKANSFTGSKNKDQKGLFEMAEGGTIFLDEISEMDINLQAKLLRVLQEGTIRPIGGSKEKKINVRVLSATNKDPLKMIYENKLRLDIYYRLAPTILTLEPLRNRPEDIEPILQSSLLKESKKTNKNLHLEKNTLEVLKRYPWPGNIRELTNAIRAAAVLCEKDTITLSDLPKSIYDYSIASEYTIQKSLKEARCLAEMEVINQALLKYGYKTENKIHAAEALGISVATLYNKLSEYKLLFKEDV